MKKNKHKIPAFTILELTIAMLLSAIVIGITYTTYSIISQAYLNFTRKNESMSILLRVDELIGKDFEKSELITFDHNILKFQASTSLVSYQFTPDFIIRNSLISDTFKVNPVNLHTFFESKETNKDQPSSTDAQPIDELSLNLLFKTDTISYHYHKSYSSQNLINNTTNAIN